MDWRDTAASEHGVCAERNPDSRPLPECAVRGEVDDAPIAAPPPEILPENLLRHLEVSPNRRVQFEPKFTRKVHAAQRKVGSFDAVLNGSIVTEPANSDRDTEIKAWRRSVARTHTPPPRVNGRTRKGHSRLFQTSAENCTTDHTGSGTKTSELALSHFNFPTAGPRQQAPGLERTEHENRSQWFGSRALFNFVRSASRRLKCRRRRSKFV